MQMLASAEMMMMNTKDYLYSHRHHHTCWGIQCWGTETKKQRNKERKKERNKLGET